MGVSLIAVLIYHDYVYSRGRLAENGPEMHVLEEPMGGNEAVGAEGDDVPLLSDGKSDGNSDEAGDAASVLEDGFKSTTGEMDDGNEKTEGGSEEGSRAEIGGGRRGDDEEKCGDGDGGVGRKDKAELIGEMDREECFDFVVYDKPMKTGSTAITQGLKRVLEKRGRRSAVCKRGECLELAEGICHGEVERVDLVQHMDGKDGVLECLKERGYYVVTSIREPFARWESAFLYNREMKGNHYGISWRVGYGEFMRRMPGCALLGYYDGLGKRCEGEVSVEERVRRIVGRYDEVIDLDEEAGQGGGVVERLIRPFLKVRNRSRRPEQGFRERFDRRRLENETVLYEALRRRRKELLNGEAKRLC